LPVSRRTGSAAVEPATAVSPPRIIFGLITNLAPLLAPRPAELSAAQLPATAAPPVQPPPLQPQTNLPSAAANRRNEDSRSEALPAWSGDAPAEWPAPAIPPSHPVPQTASPPAGAKAAGPPAAKPDLPHPAEHKGDKPGSFAASSAAAPDTPQISPGELNARLQRVDIKTAIADFDQIVTGRRSLGDLPQARRDNLAEAITLP
jgi:hypothetical protein